MAYRIVKTSSLPSLASRADDELLTVEECAAYIGVSPSTLEKWRTGSRGRFAGPVWIPLHDGDRSPIRYQIGSVRAWLASRSVDPNKPESEETPARCA